MRAGRPGVQVGSWQIKNCKFLGTSMESWCHQQRCMGSRLGPALWELPSRAPSCAMPPSLCAAWVSFEFLWCGGQSGDIPRATSCGQELS
eukprot:s1551_g17.t1